MSFIKKFTLRTFKFIVSVGFALSTMTMPHIQVNAVDNNIPYPQPGSIAVDKIATDIGGGLYEVTLTITGIPVVKASDIVLVLDTSQSMSGAKLTAMKAAARNFVDTILGRGEGHRIAIVGFAQSPVIVENFSQDATVLKNAITGLSASGYTHLEGGIYTARQLLASGTAVAANKKNIVLLGDGFPTRGYDFNAAYVGPVTATDGRDNHGHNVCNITVDTSNAANFTGRYDFRYLTSLSVSNTNNVLVNKSFTASKVCPNGLTGTLNFTGVFSLADSVRWQAEQAWASDYTVYSIGLSVDATGSTILNSIDNGGYYNGDSGDLSAIYSQIASQILQAGTDAVLLDKMGPAFTFEYISAGYEAWDTSFNHSTDILRWNIGTIGSAPMVLKYVVRIDPTLPSGHYPVNEYADLSYTNINGQAADKLFPVPEIDVLITNTAPTALDDAYSLTNDGSLDIAAPGVLSNDTDPEFDTLTAVLDLNVHHGTLSLFADGSFHYTPTAGFVGTDTFTYKAFDGEFSSNIATVTITVKPATGEALDITSYNEFYDAAAHSIIINNLQPSGDIVEYSFNGIDWFATLPEYTGVTGGSITIYVKVTNPAFEVREGSGTVQIKARPITITAHSFSRAFNGLALNADGYDLTGTLATGESFETVTISGSQIVVGSSPSTASLAKIVNGSDVDVTANYAITYTPGTLTITPATGDRLSITSYSEFYDAGAHSIIINNPLPGDDVLYSLNGTDWFATLPEYTDVTGGTVTIHVKVTNHDYAERTGSGTVAILARPITITAHSDSRAFNGLALTNSGFDLTLGDLAPGEDLDSVIVQGEQIVVGSSDNLASGAVILNGADENTTSNYDITYLKGTLTVTPATGSELDITDYSAVYDGAAHTIIVENALPGDTVEYSIDEIIWSELAPTFTDVTVPVTVFVRVTNHDYVKREGEGTVEITTRHITITAHDDDKVYDGFMLTNSGYDLTSGELAPTEVFGAVSVIGVQTDVGSSANVASGAVILHGADDVSGNYHISYIDGVLTVTPAEGEALDINDFLGVYDAAAHSISIDNVLLTDKVFYSLDEIIWSETLPEYTNVTGPVTVFVKVTNPNYIDRFGDGTVEITAREITITANSASKEFDGFPLIANGADLTGTLAGSEFISTVIVSGSQTSVGSSANVASDAVILSGTTDVTANYDIHYVDGLLTVVPQKNLAPIAVDDAYATDEDVPLSILAPGIMGNDIDNYAFEIYSFTQPANGTLALNPDGSFIYTPFADFNGTDSFTYSLIDHEDIISNTATVTLTVRPVNDAPLAEDDAYTVAEDTVLNVTAPGVLLNDSDIDSATLSAILVASPSNGTLILNANGSFTYTPNANFNGTDTFHYRAFDGDAQSYVAIVTITVTPVNDAPTAAGATYTIQRGATFSRLLARGDVDGDPLTFEIVTQPNRGSVTVNGAGRFTYVHDGIALTSDTFTYRVFDGALYSPTRTIRINFRELPVDNTAPVVNDTSFNTPFETPLNEDIAPFGSDADGNPIHFIIVTQPAHGTITLSPSGSFHYEPDATFTGTDSFTFKANDGTEDSNIAIATINVGKEIIITPEPTPQAQMPWWWLLGLLPFLLFLIRRPRPEVQEVVLNPDGTITTTWGYLGPRLMHKDYDRDESILEVVSGDVRTVPPVEKIPYEFDHGRHENIFKTVSDKNAVIRWTIKKKAEELDKELIEKMLEKNKK